MQLAKIFSLVLVATPFSALAALKTSISVPVEKDDETTSLFRRGKHWVPLNEIHKFDPLDYQYQIRYKPVKRPNETTEEKKSLSRRISHGIMKKPVFTAAIYTSAFIALNTAIVAAAIKYKERQVMKLKQKKGELPVAFPDSLAPVIKPSSSVPLSAAKVIKENSPTIPQSHDSDGTQQATSLAAAAA